MKSLSEIDAESGDQVFGGPRFDGSGETVGLSACFDLAGYGKWWEGRRCIELS